MHWRRDCFQLNDSRNSSSLRRQHALDKQAHGRPILIYLQISLHLIHSRLGLANCALDSIKQAPWEVAAIIVA